MGWGITEPDPTKQSHNPTKLTLSTNPFIWAQSGLNPCNQNLTQPTHMVYYLFLERFFELRLQNWWSLAGSLREEQANTPTVEK